MLVPATPATRITLRTPAAKPSSRNTIIPHGEIPSHLSRSHPIPAPTRTPATSSVDNRKPRAIAEASPVDRGPGSLSEGRLGRNSPSRSPSRSNRADSAASSGGGCPRSPLSRASSAMLRHPRRFRWVAAVPPPQRRADHTDWVQVSQESSPTDKSLKTKLNRLDDGRRRRSVSHLPDDPLGRPCAWPQRAPWRRFSSVQEGGNVTARGRRGAGAESLRRRAPIVYGCRGQGETS